MTDHPQETFRQRYTIRYERFYPHPVRRVWRTLTEAEHLDTWLAPGCAVDLRHGGRFGFRVAGSPDTILTGTVAELRPYEVLDFAFAGGGHLRFELRAVAGGTHLAIIDSSPIERMSPDDMELPEDEASAGRHTPERPSTGSPGTFHRVWSIDEAIERRERDTRSRPHAHTRGAGARHRPRLAERRATLRFAHPRDGQELCHRRSTVGRAHGSLQIGSTGYRHSAGESQRTRVFVAAQPARA